MKVLTLNEAKDDFKKIVEEVALSHNPVQIVSDKNNAILLSEEDWESIQETLYLLSIPEMRKKIKEGMETPIDKCSEALDW